MHASSNTPRQTHTRSVWGYLGQVSMDREEGGGGDKKRRRGREIKLEQTAAQIEGSGLPKERDQGGKKKPGRKGMSEREMRRKKQKVR